MHLERSKLTVLFLCAALFSQRAWAAGDFDGLSCDQADLAKPMVGRKLGRDTVAALKARYRSLGLKHLGGDLIDSGEVSSLSFWQLCDRNLILVIDRREFVTDAIQIESTGKNPSDDVCTTANKEDLIVLRKFNPAGAAEKAWQLNVKTKKLVPIPLEGLVCPAG